MFKFIVFLIHWGARARGLCLGALTLALALTLPVVGQDAASPSTVSQKLKALPQGEWRKVAPEIPAPRSILAYSGGAFDTKHNSFLIFGGGHGDYWGNEVWNLDMATLTWTRMYEPSAYGKLDNLKGCVEGEDRPYTRHSYNHLLFVPGVDEMLMWGGFGPTCYPRKFGGNLADETGPRKGGTSPMPSDVWTYSLARNQWTSRFSAEKKSGYPRGPDGGTAYDAKRDRVWAKTGGGSSDRLFSFNLQTNKWSKHKLHCEGKSVTLGRGAMTYLFATDRLFTRTGWLIEPASDGNPCEARRVGEELPNLKGDGGSIVALGDGKTVFALSDACDSYIFDFEAGAWKKLSLTIEGGKGSMAGSSEKSNRTRIHGPYGRLQYSPRDNVVIAVLHSGVWACHAPVSPGKSKE